MADPSDEQLREAARARGFRLVKSRRRKPGGDFGRYGLVDFDSGRECMGFGKDGLTATAAEVLSYLRGGEVASWKRSLIGVVGGEEETPKRRAAQSEVEGAKRSARPERSRRAPAPTSDRDAKQQSPAKNSGSPAPESRRRPSTSLRTSGEEDGLHDQSDRELPPEPTIREATRRDAAAIARLLDLAASTLAERLVGAIRAKEPPIVAERDGVIGICAYTRVQTLQHGPRGRITALVVAEAERRQGIGSRLLQEAERRLAEAGVGEVELLLDIDFDAPTGFLRRTGWQRRTNGYSKDLNS